MADGKGWEDFATGLMQGFGGTFFGRLDENRKRELDRADTKQGQGFKTSEREAGQENSSNQALLQYLRQQMLGEQAHDFRVEDEARSVETGKTPEERRFNEVPEGPEKEGLRKDRLTAGIYGKEEAIFDRDTRADAKKKPVKVKDDAPSKLMEFIQWIMGGGNEASPGGAELGAGQQEWTIKQTSN